MDLIDRHAKSPDMDVENCAQSYQAYTVCKNGVPVAAFGVLADMMRPGVFMVWMITGKHSGPVMLEMVRFGKWWFPSLPATRLEAYIKDDFEEAKRFIEMFGFENETPNGMVNFDGQGNTFHHYARVQG